LTFFIHPNQCLLFFRDPDATFTPERLKQALAETGVTAAGDAEPLALRCGDGPILYASIVRGEVAAVLAGRLIGRGRKHRALAAASDAYIEIKFESLDEVLDEMNTLIEVQAALQAATRGLLYRSWNQSFAGPDE
jgi:hypothetical protein